MKRISIIGLGLLGGSFAMALKRAEAIKAEIIGFSRRNETVNTAIEKGIIDKGANSIEKAVENVDLVIITTPVLAIKEVLQRISSHLSPGCLVTDSGSTKRSLMDWAEEYLPNNVGFIGGHPMAGKETSGLAEADANLFDGCIYCLTPAGTVSEHEINRLVSIIEAIGARPLFIEAALHDRLVAGISHLPMLLSSAFVSVTIGSKDWKDMAKVAARGYRDLSRLASGNPEMNRDICVTNRKEILSWLDSYIEELKKYRSLVEKDGERLRSELARAREEREKWLNDGGNK